MIRKYFPVLIILAILIFALIYLNRLNDSAEDEKKLIVYTYSSFASSWGPGPELKNLFYKKTGQNVKFIDVGEAGVIIQRVLLEKDYPQADMVLGLDQFQAKEEEIKKLFQIVSTFSLKTDSLVPTDQARIGPLLAYNWSPMTFIYRTTDELNVPHKLEDFISPKTTGKIILLDPRTSAPGFIFARWVMEKWNENEAKAFLQKLKSKVYTIAPSWSSGYGLFKTKKSNYVFSYVTSAIYHWNEEKDLSYQPLYLKEDLPYHMEYVGILKSSKHPMMAENFLKFLLSDEAQKIVMQKNYMLPVTAGVRNHTSFKKLKKIKTIEFKKNISRQDVLRIWKSTSW